MRVIQFDIPGTGRRVGVIDGDIVRDVTAARPELQRVVDVFALSRQREQAFEDCLGELAALPDAVSFEEAQLRTDGTGTPSFLPPIDHSDPHRVLISGTGLTHTGSMQSRDQMHSDDGKGNGGDKPSTPSAEMFQMGLDGGKPHGGRRGVAPEWFYKGNGVNLRGTGQPLELPAFALDGGEEPEIAGIYIVDEHGTPRRLGFALGNEWSDHVTEKINYLYLAPSKLRTCAIGPELITDLAFDEINLQCLVERHGETIYDSGPLLSGEQFMCHSLANCEDHHFKYPQHCIPGDVHVHFFGTSQLSHGTREWTYADGDIVRIESPQFGTPLVNPIVAGDARLREPVRVERA